MFTRYLGGLAASLGVAGTLVAQQPAATLATRPTNTAPTTQSVYPTTQSVYPTTRAIKAQLPDSTAGAVLGTTTTVAPNAPLMGMGAPLSTAGVPAVAGSCSDPTHLTCGPTAPCMQECGTACSCLCGPPGRFWVSGEWLYWTQSGQNVPPLVSTAPVGTARPVAGVVGLPTTTVLYGGQNINDDWRSGFRLNAGMWLDDCQRFGIEGNFFFLQPSRQGYAAGSDGSQVITRPFVNALTGANDTQLVSFPNVLAGTVTVDSKSNLIGGGANFVKNLRCDPCGRLDLLLGYQYLNLRDDLTIRENLTALQGSNVPAGTRFVIEDRFKTNNSFNGPVLGFNWERRWSHWFIGVRPSIAMGVTHSTVTIDGSTQIISPPPANTVQTFPGGLLTQSSNIGTYSTNSFSVIPQVGVRLGAQVTDHLRVFASYNFMYWSNVVRAGEQIDPRVNTNQIAPPQALNGAALPAFNFNKTGYWVQGIGIGAELRY